MAALGLRCCSWAFSGCWEPGLLSSCDAQAHCGGFSCCRALGSRWEASVVAAHRLSCSEACGIFPEPGIEPMSPALPGRFLTTRPPGKPLIFFLFFWQHGSQLTVPRSHKWLLSLSDILFTARKRNSLKEAQFEKCWLKGHRASHMEPSYGKCSRASWRLEHHCGATLNLSGFLFGLVYSYIYIFFLEIYSILLCGR